MSDNIYDQIRLEISSAIQPFGLAQQIASDLAQHITARLQQALGSSTIYFPASSGNITQRNAEIRREFTGRNHKDLCAKHNISLRTLYRVLKNK